MTLKFVINISICSNSLSLPRYRPRGQLVETGTAKHNQLVAKFRSAVMHLNEYLKTLTEGWWRGMDREKDKKSIGSEGIGNEVMVEWYGGFEGKDESSNQLSRTSTSR